MGDSTMDRYGCLVSALAMMLSLRDSEVTPGSLNRFLRNSGGYVNGNAVVFGALERYPGAGLKFISRERFSLEAMKRYLDGGYQVIAGYPGGVHWVYVLGYEGDGSRLPLYRFHDPGRAGADLRFSSSAPPDSLRVFRLSETRK